MSDLPDFLKEMLNSKKPETACNECAKSINLGTQKLNMDLGDEHRSLLAEKYRLIKMNRELNEAREILKARSQILWSKIKKIVTEENCSLLITKNGEEVEKYGCIEMDLSNKCLPEPK